jgi:presequence protease
MSTIDWQAGMERHGFKVRDVTPLIALNAVLIRLDHLRTGARYAHLATADDNNLFGVGLRTTPRDSTGVAHILEHTVLCGSRRFPVRDPFFAMIKRSLNTFMNALTSSDWTLYPFSSQNEKDFYNLMEIYLDAVFFPLLRERDFRQEGHRIEFAEAENPDSPLTFKGVVYNEMKGAMADPSSLLGRRMTRHLYPTTTYGHNSGGEPGDILDLTWEGLRAFHAQSYHPANAWFFTYGNLPLERHLKTVEEQALHHFQAQPTATAVEDEVRFTAPKRVVEGFPLDAGAPAERKAMVQVGWLACPVADSFERTALSVLSHLLLGHPGAPLHKALLDSGLGQNLAPGTGYHDDNRETYFAAGLQGTDPQSADAIEQLILATLEDAARQGFPPERIEAAIHQLEFSFREVSGDHYPYPLSLLMRMMGPWLHNDDPLTPLLLDEQLERLRAEGSGSFFSDLIRSRLLDNRHRVTLLLQPDETMGPQQDAQTAARLEKIRQQLSPADKQTIIAQAVELRRAQETPEDLSVLPTLERSDIPATEREVPFQRSGQETPPVFWFDQPTNGIGYFSASLPAADLPPRLRPWLPLFCAALTQVGAAGRPYTEMAERMAAATGGIRAGSAVHDDPFSLDRFLAITEVKGKALLRNQGSLFAILADIAGAPDFTDLSRLQTVLGQVKINLENSIPSSGHSYAARAAAAGLTAAGRQREEWGGLQLVRLARQVAELPAEGLKETADIFQELARQLLTRQRLRCAITAEEHAFGNIDEHSSSFFSSLQEGKAEQPSIPPFQAQPRQSGWITSVPVAYTARVFRTVPFSHADAAGLMVLSKLLRAGFLHREIREKGGAYGGMAGCDPESGLFSMLSYRDPQPGRTLQVYRQAIDWAISGAFGDEEIKEAVLAVFGNLDRPLSPGGKGHREFASQLQGLTLELRRQFREQILAVEKKTLIDLAGHYLADGWDHSSVSVIAGEQMLQQVNTALGTSPLVVERI